MKISNRGGHNRQVPGAAKYVDEITEDRKINAATIKYQKLNGDTSIDVTPGNCSSPIDLAYGVDKSNNAKVDLFVSNHINAGGGHGVEVIYFPGSTEGKLYAERVCAAIVKLGFNDRGAKADTRGLYELRNAKMPCIIVEPFFVDSVSDVALYHKVGADAIGKAIAEGIVGHSIGAKATTTKVATETFTVRLNDGKTIVANFDDLYKAKDYANLHMGYKVYDSKDGYRYMLAATKSVTSDEPFRVVTGSFSDETNADKRIAELKKLGITSFKTQK